MLLRILQQELNRFDYLLCSVFLTLLRRKEMVTNLSVLSQILNARVSDRVIRKRYIWPAMHRDISVWCKACLDCQQSKISRHNHLAPAQFSVPDGRFKHIHLDIVGPLPDSDGYRYCLTIIDRFSRWPEAVSLKNIEAIIVYRTFYDTWISRYCSSEKLTTDQGSQFET